MNIVIKECPHCNRNTRHKILKANAQYLIRCEGCTVVYKINRIKRKKHRIKLVISSKERSQKTIFETFADDIISLYDELVIETQEGPHLAEVTSIELNGKKEKSSQASRVTLLCCRDLEDIAIKSMIDGKSRFLKFHGTEVLEVGGWTDVFPSLPIVQLKLRDGRVFKRRGARTQAKNVNRIDFKRR